jgi:pyruvate/2-oxoglutarate/acetoin dehydrogenase E1 component
MKAAETLAKEGIELEIIDLRTLVPPDMPLVYESVARTGRLLVAAEDRNFAGFVRQIEGDCTERFSGLPALGIGQKYVPGIAQCLALEEATVLTWEDVHRAAHALCGERLAASRNIEVAPRYFLV